VDAHAELRPVEEARERVVAALGDEDWDTACVDRVVDAERPACRCQQGSLIKSKFYLPATPRGCGQKRALLRLTR
jgi:hypothetical protein